MSFLADRSVLEPLFERRASSGARVEDLPPKDDSENRISKFKRKDWGLSKSQVIAEKAPEPDIMVKRERETEGEGARERMRTNKCKPTLHWLGTTACPSTGTSSFTT